MTGLDSCTALPAAGPMDTANAESIGEAADVLPGGLMRVPAARGCSVPLRHLRRATRYLSLLLLLFCMCLRH